VATHTWNSVTLSRAVRVISDRSVRRELVFGYPGLSGVDTVDLDQSVRVVEMVGEKQDADVDTLLDWFATWRGKLGEVSTLSMYGGDESVEHCKCTFVRTPLSPAETGFAARWRAVFTQVQPNDT